MIQMATARLATASDRQHVGRRVSRRIEREGRARSPATMKKALTTLLAAIMRARASVGRVVLDDRVERHAERAAAGGEREQVDQHPPALERTTSTAAVSARSARRHRRRGEVPAEDRDAERRERHMPGGHLALEQPRAQHRSQPDADRKHGQQQRRDIAVGVQHVADDRRKLGQQGRAHHPEPRQPEDREPDRPDRRGLPHDAPGLQPAGWRRSRAMGRPAALSE